MANNSGKTNFNRIIAGSSIGFAFFIVLQLIGAALINGEVVVDDCSKLISYISVFVGCIVSVFLICGNDRLIIWIGLNILIWCTALWTLGMLFFKEVSSLMIFISVLIVITVASILGAVIKVALGGRR